MPALSQEVSRTRTVAVLAEEFHAPLEDVATLYERERALLAMGARVTTYLDIFVLRKVRDTLQRRMREDEQATC